MYLGNKDVWRIFPSVERLAFYHPIGNFIYFNKLTENQFRAVKEKPNDYSEHYCTMLHEMQHWVDHVSTLWGQWKLLKIFKAFDGVFKAQEAHQAHLKVLFDDFKQDRLETYYSEIYNKIQGTKDYRWKYSFSTGIRFDNSGHLDESRSTIFVRFNSYKDEPISRVPLSVASLLESTAMNSEITGKLLYIKSLSKDAQLIEFKALSNVLIKRIYNPELTLYSVAVHTASNLLGISDPVIGYSITSQIATLCLNLPLDQFDKIKIPEDYSKTWGDRPKNMLKAHDRGFAYLCLIQNYKDTYGNVKDDKISIKNILNASKLDNIETLETKINKESESILEDLMLDSSGFCNLLGDKISTGNSLRNTRGIAQEKAVQKDFESLQFNDSPYLIFNDTFFEYENLKLDKIFIKISEGQTINREEWWRVFEFCEKKIDDFSEICGV